MSPDLYIIYGIVLIIVIIAAMVIFRRPITALLGRIRSAGPRGVHFDSQQQSTQRPNPRREAERLLRQLDDQTLVAYENAIKTELESLGLLEPSAHTQALPVLIRYMAQLQVDNEFYEIYRTIFGSQLRALNMLNGSSESVGPQRLEMFLLEAASNHPDVYRNIQFNSWFEFIRTAQLVTTDSGGAFQITQRGRSFLSYLIRRGFSQDLPY